MNEGISQEGENRNKSRLGGSARVIIRKKKEEGVRGNKGGEKRERM